MAAETQVYRNPKSTRAHLAMKRVREVLHRTQHQHDVISSETPDSDKNAQELAEKLEHGMTIVVVGGDGLVGTVANAIKLADVENLKVVAFPGGDRCDTAETWNRGRNLAAKGILARVLAEGIPVPVNTLGYDIKGNLSRSGLAASYMGFGLAGKSAKIASGHTVRGIKASIPGHERLHKAVRVVDYVAVGAMVVGGLPFHSFDIDRDGEINKLNDLTYFVGNHMAGMFNLPGDVFKKKEPRVSYYETPSSHFVSRLPGILRSLQKGSLEPTRTTNDTIRVLDEIDAHADGEHFWLPAGSEVSVGIDRGTFSTLVLPEDLLGL
jgi:hypothetical protein